MRLKIIMSIVMLLISIGVIIVLLNMDRILTPSSLIAEKNEVVDTRLIARTINQCDIAISSCSVDIEPDNHITLALGTEAKAMVAFPIDLTVTGTFTSQIKSVSIAFSMQTMDMGVQLIPLVPDQSDRHRWQAQAILPACMSGSHAWIADLVLQLKAGTKISLSYYFTLPG